MEIEIEENIESESEDDILDELVMEPFNFTAKEMRIFFDDGYK